MPKPKFDGKNPGKTYQVTAAAQQVGPWLYPAVFNEAALERMFPAADASPDTYHVDLVARLLVTGAIVEVPEARPTEIDAGPYGGVEAANNAIRESIAEHAKTLANRAQVMAADAAAKETTTKPAAHASPPAAVNAQVTRPVAKA